MHEPELYHKSYEDLKQDTGQWVKKYMTKFQWRNDGSDILMDLGTGPGDLFMDYILPEVPKNCHKIICTDILQDMLDYARNHHQNRAKIAYRIMDITTEVEKLPSDLKGKVHHITSVFLMHWVEDHRKALKNMYELLSPGGGECLIIFMPCNTIFDANDYMRTTDKWGDFFKVNDNKFIPTSFEPQEAAREFRRLLEDTGFSDITMEVAENAYFHHTLAGYKENITAVCTLMDYVPEDRREEFRSDYVTAMLNIVAKDEDFERMPSKYINKYTLIAVHAKRLQSV